MEEFRRFGDCVFNFVAVQFCHGSDNLRFFVAIHKTIARKDFYNRFQFGYWYVRSRLTLNKHFISDNFG